MYSYDIGEFRVVVNDEEKYFTIALDDKQVVPDTKFSQMLYAQNKTGFHYSDTDLHYEWLNSDDIQDVLMRDILSYDGTYSLMFRLDDSTTDYILVSDLVIRKYKLPEAVIKFKLDLAGPYALTENYIVLLAYNLFGDKTILDNFLFNIEDDIPRTPYILSYAEAPNTLPGMTVISALGLGTPTSKFGRIAGVKSVVYHAKIRGILRNALVKWRIRRQERNKKLAASNLIKRFFKRAYYNPAYKLCKRRLMKQFSELNEESCHR
jgi:hypothetical protein